MDHWEEKRDDRIIGRYALLEPGGYVRSVYYVVDGGSGFRSSVQTRMLGCSDFKISFLYLFSISFKHFKVYRVQHINSYLTRLDCNHWNHINIIFQLLSYDFYFIFDLELSCYSIKK